MYYFLENIYINSIFVEARRSSKIRKSPSLGTTKKLLLADSKALNKKENNMENSKNSEKAKKGKKVQIDSKIKKIPERVRTRRSIVSEEDADEKYSKSPSR